MSLTEMQQTLKQLTRGYSATARRIRIQLATGNGGTAGAGAVSPSGMDFIFGPAREATATAFGPARDATIFSSGPARDAAATASGPSRDANSKASEPAAAYAGPDVYDACDHFIERCKLAILSQDVQAARAIRNQATLVFEGVIPGWHQALMGQFTGFYLDDAEMILGKLSIFKANRDSRKPHDYVNLTRVANRVMTLHETFERVIAEIRTESRLSPADFPSFQSRLKQFQDILEASLDPEDRWERARPFLLWATTLDAALARHVLPLLNYSVK